MNLIMIGLILIVVSLVISDKQKEKRIEHLENLIGTKHIKPSINNLYRKIYMEDLAIGNGTVQVRTAQGNIVVVHEINIDILEDL